MVSKKEKEWAEKELKNLSNRFKGNTEDQENNLNRIEAESQTHTIQLGCLVIGSIIMILLLSAIFVRLGYITEPMAEARAIAEEEAEKEQWIKGCVERIGKYNAIIDGKKVDICSEDLDFLKEGDFIRYENRDSSYWGSCLDFEIISIGGNSPCF
jgi:hypothetical protein